MGNLARVEVSDREVADRTARGLQRADLARDAEDLRAHDAAGERGETRVGLLRRLKEGGDVHCGESIRFADRVFGGARPT